MLSPFIFNLNISLIFIRVELKNTNKKVEFHKMYGRTVKAYTLQVTTLTEHLGK